MLEDLEAETDAKIRAHMECDLKQVGHVLEIIRELIEKTGY